MKLNYFNNSYNLYEQIEKDILNDIADSTKKAFADKIFTEYMSVTIYQEYEKIINGLIRKKLMSNNNYTNNMILGFTKLHKGLSRKKIKEHLQQFGFNKKDLTFLDDKNEYFIHYDNFINTRHATGHDTQIVPIQIDVKKTIEILDIIVSKIDKLF